MVWERWSECILALWLLLHAGFPHWGSAELFTQIHNPHRPPQLQLRSAWGQRVFSFTKWRYNYRLKEPILKSLWGHGTVFSYNSPNLNEFARNLEYKCRTTVHIHTKRFHGNRPIGSAKCRQNIFITNTAWHRFRLCLKQQTWIGVPERKSVRNFRISA